jgi:hypothetical protein
MTRHYQLREPEYVRQAMAALIAMKLEVEDTNLVLYRPLPPELEPVFRRALERIEAGIPLAQIPELVTVRAHLDTEEHTRRDFYQFKRNYRKLSLLLAEAPTPPEPAQAQSLLSLLASHPAVSPTSITARQLAHDFARYPIFTLSEYLDARYLAELEDSGWSCPFWLGRFYESLRIRHHEPTAEVEDYWMPRPAQPFDQPPSILFRDRAFLFTGKFEFGPRRKCRETVVSRGGRWEQNITRAVDCLVVAGSGDCVTQFSGKSSGWLELRRRGWPCLLISEQQWVAALNAQ